MNLGSLRPWFVLITAFALLTGCPSEDVSSPAASSTPKYMAIARGRIDVEGGVLKLGMHREGVVTEIGANEGDHVHKGQLLASLDSELAQLAVTAAQAEQQQIERRTQQLTRNFKSADLKAKRLTSAASAGAGDEQSADDAREAAQQLHDQIDNNRAEAAVTALKLTTARYELAQRSLYAPFDAEVIRRLVQPGASVSVQSGPSFILLSNEERFVRAELNESFIGVVVPGMKAQITDDTGSGLPPLSARVLRISAVFGNNTLEDDPLVRSNTRTVECILAFDQPVPASLRIGQRMLVRFGVGRRYKQQFNSPFPATTESQDRRAREGFSGVGLL